uniref:hypothetical protein n=1 Tax=Cellvibrio fontiphilus TaxID=1815559 RepID=UPI002B4BF187|nr:hypothetical protein [Cellvibrio fontiphilus]
MKKALLTAEVLIILGPLTAVLCYTTLLAVVVGVPVSVMQLIGKGGADGLNILLATLGNFFGVYALFILWGLINATIREEIYYYSSKFKIALFLGLVASSILVYLYGKLGFMFGVLPPILILLQFIYLQSALTKNV